MWYQALAVIASNAAIVFLVAVALTRVKHVRRGGRALYLPDPDVFTAIIAGGTGLVSVTYHLCQMLDVCARPFKSMQGLDHVNVWVLIVWLYLKFLTLRERVALAVLLAVREIFEVFPRTVVVSGGFEAAMVAAMAVLLGVRVFIAEQPYHIADVVFAAFTGAVFFAPGLFFINYADVGDPDYWWSHSPWHVLSMLGAAVAYVYIEYGMIGNRVGEKKR